MSMQNGIPILMPDGSLVVPRDTYRAAVALAKWALDHEGEQTDVSIDLDGAQAIVWVCEHFGMPQATYREIDPWLREIRNGALSNDGAE